MAKNVADLLIGDGGLTMLMAEVATLLKYNLRVKVIVIKNNVLGMTNGKQMVFGGSPQFGVDAKEPAMPGKITTEQAWHFIEVLARGERDCWDVIKTVAKDVIREVI